MAIPAMAGYGIDIYNSPTGAALFWITELGMWSFAIATEVSRRLHPDRPVWSLQLGVWLFAAAAFGVNFSHGASTDVAAGLVMGTVSVAGVIAHQLVTAAPRRSRTERLAARTARRIDRKVARVQRTAVRTAVAHIAAGGQVELVFVTGNFTLDTTWVGRTRLTLATGTEQAASASGRVSTSASTGDASIPSGHDRSTSPARTPRQGRKAARKVKRGRKYVADYVADARASWSPGVEITPAWARRASGCSGGISAKVADQLRTEIETNRPTVQPAPAAAVPGAVVENEQEAA